jgi:hypothetical protein
MDKLKDWILLICEILILQNAMAQHNLADVLRQILWNTTNFSFKK